MSDSGSENGGGNRERNNQGEELATRTISIQAKRFYLDVKQNNRGRFIKFAEVCCFEHFYFNFVVGFLGGWWWQKESHFYEYVGFSNTSGPFK